MQDETAAPAVTSDVWGEHHYAYRRFGTADGIPLVLLQHFRGTMDNWDPSVTNRLAAHHDVILFNNAGVGGSSGAPATSVSEMASHVATFVKALGLRTVDLLGFSLGASLHNKRPSTIPLWSAASCSPAAARAADRA